MSMQPWARPWAGQGLFQVEVSTAQTPTASVPFLGVNMLTILKNNFFKSVSDDVTKAQKD